MSILTPNYNWELPELDDSLESSLPLIQRLFDNVDTTLYATITAVNNLILGSDGNISDIKIIIQSSTGVFNIDCSSEESYFSITLEPKYKPIIIGNTATADVDVGSRILTLPTNMQVGDLMIMAVGNDDTQPPTQSGWTSLYGPGGSTVRYYVAYKVVTQSDLNATITIPDAAGAGTAVVMAFRNVDTTTPLAVPITSASGSSGVPDSPLVPSSGTLPMAGCAIVSIGFLDDANIIPSAPSGFEANLVYRYSVYTGVTTMLAAKVANSSSAVDPGVFGTSGNDEWVACSLALRPAMYDATIAFTNVPIGVAYSCTVKVNQASSVITWPANVYWAYDEPPLLVSGKTHLFAFITDDAGTTWMANSIANITI